MEKKNKKEGKYVLKSRFNTMHNFEQRQCITNLRMHSLYNNKYITKRKNSSLHFKKIITDKTFKSAKETICMVIKLVNLKQLFFY